MNKIETKDSICSKMEQYRNKVSLFSHGLQSKSMYCSPARKQKCKENNLPLTNIDFEENDVSPKRKVQSPMSQHLKISVDRPRCLRLHHRPCCRKYL